MDDEFYKILNKLQSEKSEYLRKDRGTGKFYFTDSDKQTETIARMEWIKKNVVDFQIWGWLASDL